MSETQQTETQQPANDTLTPECFVALADFQARADRLKAASRRQRLTIHDLDDAEAEQLAADVAAAVHAVRGRAVAAEVA